MPVTQIQVNPPFNVLEIFFSILGNSVEFFSFYFDDVFTLSVSQARYLPFRAFFIVSREKIHLAKRYPPTY